MRIVVDVMGGDHGCDVVIEGVRRALRAYPQITSLCLVGDEPGIRRALAARHVQDGRVEVIHTCDVLTMEDKPTDVLRRKKACSMARALDLAQQGRGDAVISRGNTGGLLAAATVKLRPLEHVDRPAIAAVIPRPRKEFLLLDAGANAECKPIHLVQFAIMGSVYSREILGNANPRVGILSNGTEEHKGNDLTREAADLCRQTRLNFVGYIEGQDAFEDRVDVVVADGFIGNIVLKSIEGMGKGIKAMLQAEFTRNPLRRIGAALGYGGIRAIKQRMNPDNYGGAPLLGLNGTVIKAHGSAREVALMNAIRVATETIDHNINHRIIQEVADANQRLSGARPVVQATAAA